MHHVLVVGKSTLVHKNGRRVMFEACIAGPWVAVALELSCIHGAKYAVIAVHWYNEQDGL
jgi:hypothetical protein